MAAERPTRPASGDAALGTPAGWPARQPVDPAPDPGPDPAPAPAPDPAPGQLFDPAHGRDLAIERLLLSRQRLRDALTPGGAARARGAATAGAPEGPFAGAAAGPGRWHQQALPRLLGAVLGRWWQNHPLHLAGTLMARTGGVALRPLARDHPLALVAAATAAGALLAWARPWRWRLPPVLLAGLAPQLLREGLALLARRPPP